MIFMDLRKKHRDFWSYITTIRKKVKCFERLIWAMSHARGREMGGEREICSLFLFVTETVADDLWNLHFNQTEHWFNVERLMLRYYWCSNVLVFCFERVNSVIAPIALLSFNFHVHAFLRLIRCVTCVLM